MLNVIEVFAGILSNLVVMIYDRCHMVFGAVLLRLVGGCGSDLLAQSGRLVVLFDSVAPQTFPRVIVDSTTCLRSASRYVQLPFCTFSQPPPLSSVQERIYSTVDIHVSKTE